MRPSLDPPGEDPLTAAADMRVPLTALRRQVHLHAHIQPLIFCSITQEMADNINKRFARESIRARCVLWVDDLACRAAAADAERAFAIVHEVVSALRLRFNSETQQGTVVEYLGRCLSSPTQRVSVRMAAMYHTLVQLEVVKAMGVKARYPVSALRSLCGRVGWLVEHWALAKFWARRGTHPTMRKGHGCA